MTNTKPIALNKLSLSPSNVRKTPASEASDAQLLASIRAKGLLQNLIVTPNGDGTFGVIGSGRRLKALNIMCEEGDIPSDFAVDCMPSDESAVETSLAENNARASMHPLDEYEAFAKLLEEGLTEEEISLHFGISKRIVKQRLSMGQIVKKRSIWIA